MDRNPFGRFCAESFPRLNTINIAMNKGSNCFDLFSILNQFSDVLQLSLLMNRTHLLYGKGKKILKSPKQKGDKISIRDL
ncbi:hypothetical protein AVL50_23660 [Flammeovirga sp. SJP92]|nr:hypothetical protein AVL50_23660 [Flammeovirga sp. SJP92]